MDNTRRLAKEICQVTKKIDHFSNNQARISKWNSNNIKEIIVEIIPNDGYYKGGKYEFEVSVSLFI